MRSLNRTKAAENSTPDLSFKMWFYTNGFINLTQINVWLSETNNEKWEYSLEWLDDLASGN